MSKKKRILHAKPVIVDKPLAKALKKSTVANLAFDIGALVVAAKFNRQNEIDRLLEEIRTTLRSASEGFEYDQFIPAINDVILRGIAAAKDHAQAVVPIVKTETLDMYLARGGIITKAVSTKSLTPQQAKAISLESLGL